MNTKRRRTQKQKSRIWREDPFKKSRSPFPHKPTQVHEEDGRSERRRTKDELRKGVWG